jgi:hypothetical protein
MKGMNNSKHNRKSFESFDLLNIVYGRGRHWLNGHWLKLLCRLFYVLAAFALPVFAAGNDQLTTTLCQVYRQIYDLVPIFAFVLFVLAGAAYAAGQFFGAEMRARAQSWSMSMVTGAIIGLLIILLSNIIIKNLTQQDINVLCPP